MLHDLTAATAAPVLLAAPLSDPMLCLVPSPFVFHASQYLGGGVRSTSESGTASPTPSFYTFMLP